jgi:hypothetical protein
MKRIIVFCLQPDLADAGFDIDPFAIRPGEFTITKDPTRAKGLRVLMGPFTVYNKDNIEAAAK